MITPVAPDSGSALLGLIVACALLVCGVGVGVVIPWISGLRARRRQALAEVREAYALARTCPPCNNHLGVCHCRPWRCGHPDCTAPAPVTGKLAALLQRSPR